MKPLFRQFLQLVLFASIVALAGCGTELVRRTVPADRWDGLRGSEQEPLKAHLRSGHMILFEEWQVSEATRTIEGEAQEFDLNRKLIARAKVSYPIDSVVLFETNSQYVPSSVSGLTVISVLSSAVVVFCIINPKSCFGSCPTVYTEQNGKLHLDAEGFSASVLPSLKAVDVDRLTHATPVDGVLQLTLTNEALETHVIDRMDVLEVPAIAGKRVVRCGDSSFYYVSNITAPSSVTAHDSDIAGLLTADDDREYFSLADSNDLSKEETIELTFTGSSQRPGLLLRTRQSLVSTYVFYQSLGYLGKQATGTLARLDMGPAKEMRKRENIAGIIAQLRVEVQNGDGSWRTIDTLEEHGPIAFDEHLVALPTGTTRVRLRCAQGALRFDQVAMCSIDGEAKAKRIEPSRVTTGEHDAPEALADLLETGRSLKTFAGDKYKLSYRVSEAPSEYFLESEGYYLEWMREEWLKDENAMLSAEVLQMPRAALKRMTKGYKEMEPYMEQEFWSSRFARP